MKAKASNAPQNRQVRVRPKVLRFISENQRLSGFSGRITAADRRHKTDMAEVAESARRFGAQIPSTGKKFLRAKIKRFGQTILPSR